MYLTRKDPVLQHYDVRSKSKDFGGKVAMISASIFIGALAIIGITATPNEPTPAAARAMFAIPGQINTNGTLPTPMQKVPSRYTTEVHIDHALCTLKLEGASTKKAGSSCWVVIDRHIWTGGLVTGEPGHIKPLGAPIDGKLMLAIDGAATLFLNNPGISPRYPLPNSALGNHVAHYTPHGAEWIDFE